jgi:hypothetical protein
MPESVTRNMPTTSPPPPCSPSETTPILSLKSAKRVFLILPSATTIFRAKPPLIGVSARVEPSMAESFLKVGSESFAMPGAWTAEALFANFWPLGTLVPSQDFSATTTDITPWDFRPN